MPKPGGLYGRPACVFLGFGVPCAVVAHTHTRGPGFRLGRVSASAVLYVLTRAVAWTAMPILSAMTLSAAAPWWLLAASFGVTNTLLAAGLWCHARLGQRGREAQ